MKDSGAELLLGDFSDNGNEQVPMGGNSSSSKLEKRQDRALIAGTLINLRKQERQLVRTCTLGFSVMRISGTRQFNQGYLTAGSCSSNRQMTSTDVAFVVVNNAGETIVGTRSQTRGTYNPENGLDYAIIKVEDNY